jgi:hypothetical protein
MFKWKELVCTTLKLYGQILKQKIAIDIEKVNVDLKA